MEKNGLEFNNSNEIGFVSSALIYKSVTIEEVKEWLYNLISKYNNLPTYIFDLVDFNGTIPGKMIDLIDFVPHWPFSEKEKQALYGIAYKRGFKPYDCPFTKEEAIKRLQECPHIEKKFRDTFPFIDF